MDSVTGLDVSAAWLNSNQNNYDTTRTVFNNDYYDYVVWTAGLLGFPFVSIKNSRSAWGRRGPADVTGVAPVQDVDGTHSTGHVTTTSWTYRLSLGYPLMEHLDAVLTGAYQDASNMKYESVYRYNYSSARHYGVFA